MFYISPFSIKGGNLKKNVIKSFKSCSFDLLLEITFDSYSSLHTIVENNVGGKGVKSNYYFSV